MIGRCFRSFLMALTLFSQVVSAAQPSAASSEAVAKRAEDAALAAKRDAENIAQREKEVTLLLNQIKASSAEMTDRAQWLDKMSTTTVAFVGVGSTVLGLFAAVGLWQSGKLRQQSRQALSGARRAAASIHTVKGQVDREAAEIDKIKEELKRQRLSLDTLQAKVVEALKGIERELNDEGLTASTGLIGVPLATAIPQRAYDNDGLIVFADRVLRDIGPDLPAPEMAKFLVMAGHS